MATAQDAEAIAAGLEGTTTIPHMERTAFKVVRMYATLAPGGTSINLKLTLDEQEFNTLLAPEIYSAIPHGWGRMGWTTALLAPMPRDELAAVLRTAWAHALKTSARP